MSEIHLLPADHLGCDFSGNDASRELPFDTKKKDWHPLTLSEITSLESGGNTSDDWANILVLKGFDTQLVVNCHFYGEVKIGRLSRSFLDFHDLRLPVGLYNCTVVSCEIGNETALHNITYMARMTVEDHCMLFNINELITTDHAKFGNGIVIDGEKEEVRIWLEIANENGGRKVLPFDGILPADAWIWSKYRDDKILQNRFVEMTGKVKDSRRGQYGRIGSETIIKNCRILKDVKIGTNAYIKGCNKLKNLTINSDTDRPTQLGEGCELVNGIVGYGCHVFYGVKAVRFVLNDHSNLKYGARLINSILGSNSTISCCEVLNSLIFGFHEQHHNSSFLCASTLKGQTNMASAATVGSNHNSRSSDGEIIADRGFWPGLNVSLKHNSRFASFSLIVKGTYPAELDIPLPFTLVSNDENSGELLLMPGYWFHYNMYALARNVAKTSDRDRRLTKHQELEFDWLAPDTVDQMRQGRKILEGWADESAAVVSGEYPSGRAFLEAEKNQDLFSGASYRVEAGKRRVRILHAGRAWQDYGRMIRYYAVCILMDEHHAEESPTNLPIQNRISTAKLLRKVAQDPWENVGGQLMLRSDLEDLKNRIRSGKIRDWSMVHDFYREIGALYQKKKTLHAQAVLAEIVEDRTINSSGSHGEKPNIITEKLSDYLRKEALETAGFILKGIRESRKKDYTNHFRNITFDSNDERDAVIGAFEDNSFIHDAEKMYQNIHSILSAEPCFDQNKTKP